MSTSKQLGEELTRYRRPRDIDMTPSSALQNEVLKNDPFFIDVLSGMSDDDDSFEEQDWTEDRYGHVELSQHLVGVDGGEFGACLRNFIPIPESYFEDLDDEDECLVWGNQLATVVMEGMEYDENIFIEKATRLFFSTGEYALVRFDLVESRDPIRALVILLTNFREHENSGSNEIFKSYQRRVPFFSGKDGRPEFIATDEILMPREYGTAASVNGYGSAVDLEFLCCVDSICPGLGDVFVNYAKVECLEKFHVPWTCSFSVRSRFHQVLNLGSIQYPFNAEVRRYGTKGSLNVFEPFYFCRQKGKKNPNQDVLFLVPTGGLRGAIIKICQDDMVLWEITEFDGEFVVHFRQYPRPSHAYLKRSRLCDQWSILDQVLPERYYVQAGQTVEVKKTGESSYLNMGPFSPRTNLWKNGEKRDHANYWYNWRCEIEDEGNWMTDMPPRWSVHMRNAKEEPHFSDNLFLQPREMMPFHLTFWWVVDQWKINPGDKVMFGHLWEGVTRWLRGSFPNEDISYLAFMALSVIAELHRKDVIDVRKHVNKVVILFNTNSMAIPKFTEKKEVHDVVVLDVNYLEYDTTIHSLTWDWAYEDNFVLSNLKTTVGLMVTYMEFNENCLFRYQPSPNLSGDGMIRPCVKFGPLELFDAFTHDRILDAVEKKKDEVIVPANEWYEMMDVDIPKWPDWMPPQ